MAFGKALLVVTNEVSGTITMYKVEKIKVKVTRRHDDSGNDDDSDD